MLLMHHFPKFQTGLHNFVAAALILFLAVAELNADEPAWFDGSETPAAVGSPEPEAAVVGTAAEFGIAEVADGLVVRIAPAQLHAAAFEADGVKRARIRLHVPMIDRKVVSLDLRPISLRDPDYELREQLADGSWRTIDPGPERTYTGRVSGEPAGYVAASLLSDGLFAEVVFSDGEKHWIQPLSDFQIGAEAGLHVVYRGDDTLCEGSCGMDGETFAIPAAETQWDEYNVTGTCGGDACVAQLACDADFEYFTAHVSSSHATQDRIFATVNVVNHQYVRQVHITHTITTVLVRTAEPDPYTSNISDILMCQFITEWTDNQAGVTRDLAKLFTGRNISGAITGQAANFAQICDNSGFCTIGLDNGAYCYTQTEFSSTFACQTDVTAHEMGHLWGAHHCTCPNSTMNPSIECVNTFGNSGGLTVAEIDAHADAITCLSPLNNPPPNDTCDDATVLAGTGTYEGTNANASTDGGATGCGSLGGNVGGGSRDVFFRVTPIANGTLSVNTCGSNFDTMLTVHTGCPTTPVNQLTCNDDCGGNPCGCCDSCLTFSATSGTTYYLRVAGYAGANGSIVLNVDGPLTPGNNLCSSAFELENGVETAGSLALATNDGSASCGSSSTNPDVWYAYTAGTCGGTLTADTCGTHDRIGQDTGMDTVVSIHSACPGQPGNQLVCIDDASPACAEDNGLIRDSRATVQLDPDESVLIRVSHFSTAIDDGFFFLHVNEDEDQFAPLVMDIANASHSCGGQYVGPIPTLTNPTCMNQVTWSLITGPTGMTINATNGRVTWPTPTIAGSPHSVTIRATNAAGFDDETWALTVNPASPFVATISDAIHVCGTAYTGPTPGVTNPTCMDPVTWSLPAGPAGMTINASTGVVNWPTPTVAGSPHTVTIRATNTAGFDDETWLITVGRQTPAITAISDATHTCGGAYTGPTPTLTNPSCMNPVSWSLVTGPVGLSVNPLTGVVTLPTPTIAGSPHTITIRATNTAGFADETWLLTVARQVPSVAPIPDASHDCGGAYVGPTPAVTNPVCMVPVAWSLVTGPQGMTINAASGVVTWPTPTSVGSSHIITIRATNSTGADEESWRLDVDVVAPIVNDVPNVNHACTATYVGPTPALANPTCMNPTSWMLAAAPPGMTINPNTGVVTWPMPTVVGSPHPVSIRAVNAAGSDIESWTINVTGLAPVVNNIVDVTAPAGRPYNGPLPTVTLPNCMNPLTWSLVMGPAGMTIDVSSGIVSWPEPTTEGSPHLVTIRAANGVGMDDESWRITVNAVGCDQPCADFDDDGDVDLSDFTLFAACVGLTSPSIDCPDTVFECADLNGSGTIDLLDYSIFSLAFGMPASGMPPNCE